MTLCQPPNEPERADSRHAPRYDRREIREGEMRMVGEAPPVFAFVGFEPERAGRRDATPGMTEALRVATTALAWYADERHWSDDAWGCRGVVALPDYPNGGQKARDALERIECRHPPRGFRFHLRTVLWALTHPFSSTWRNPGVQETLGWYEAEVARITAVRIADDLREEFPPSDIPDYIDRNFGGVDA